MEEGLNKLLQKLESIEKTSEGKIVKEFLKLKLGDNEISFELKAELMAFKFFENNQNDWMNWGTYFGPEIAINNGDGTITESPSIQNIDEKMLDYWEKRLYETQNPFLKARYAGLVYDFSPPILGDKAKYQIQKIYVESLLEAVEKRIPRHIIESFNKIGRALEVAIRLNDNAIIKRAKILLIDFENEVNDQEEHGVWSYSYNLLIEKNKKVLDENEKKTVIHNLEKRLNNLLEKRKGKYTLIENEAKKIAKYYQGKQNSEKVKEWILKIGQSYNIDEENIDAFQLSARLDILIKIYSDYGLKEEANQLQIRLRKIGTESREFLKPIPIPFSQEMPIQEWEKFLAFILDGTKEEIIGKLIFQFVLNKEEVKKQVVELAKAGPSSFLFQTQIVDAKGRVLAKIGSLEDDTEGHLIHHLTLFLKLSSPFIHDVLQRIIKNNILTVDDWVNFILQSPIIEESRFPIIKKGLEAYFQEDYLVAIHLLIPQIEEAIRNLVELGESNIFKTSRNGAYQLVTFHELLNDSIIYNTFGEDIQFYLKVLLVDSRGWNLRNKVSHGLMNIDDFDLETATRILHILLILGTLKKDEK